MAILPLLDSDMPSFALRAEALAEWWQGPCGHYLASEQAQLLAALDYAGGYHQLQLSSFGHQFVLPNGSGQAPAGHPFALHPTVLAGDRAQLPAALADFAELPLPSGVIDHLILHHALEYSRRPREVLAESARVLADGGQLTLIGFNPLSPWGSVAPLLGRLGRCGRIELAPVGRFHRLRAARLVDWLALLQLQVASISYGAYNPPLPWQWALHSDWRWQRWLRERNAPLASCVVIHAIKRSAARLPTRPAPWRRSLARPASRAVKAGQSTHSTAAPPRASGKHHNESLHD